MTILLFIPTYLLLLISIVYFFKYIKIFTIEFGLLIGITYFIFIPLSVYLINGGYSSYDLIANTSWSDHLKTYTDIEVNMKLSILLFLNLLLLYIRPLLGCTSKNNINYSYYVVTLKKIFFILLLGIIPLIFLEILVPSSITHWYKKAQYINENFGMVAVISKYLYTSIKFVLLVVLLNNFIITKKYFYLLLLLLFAFVDMYIIGNRIFLVLVVFTIIFELLLLKKYKLLNVILLTGFPLASFLIAWAEIRALMSTMPLIDAIKLSYNVFKKINLNDIIFQFTEGADFLTLLSIIRDFGTEYTFIYGSSLIKFFVFFIPRSLWEEKPDSIARVMGEIYQPETSGFALNTTLLGEEYANFGLLGFFTIAILIVFFTYFSYKSNKFIHYHMHTFYFAFAFLIIRTNVSDILLQFTISYIILFFLSFQKGRI